MLRFCFALVVALCALPADARIWEKQYEQFSVWLDCNNHGAIAFHYELTADQSQLGSNGSWGLDNTVPITCQPITTDSYRTPAVPASAGTYDRGHLVPANHQDESAALMDATYVTTNALPQHSDFNGQGGAWFRTEVISECYRDITDLSIWGGVIWGGDLTNDFFVASHGVFTPDFWWKLIYRHDTNQYVAWIMPNSPDGSDANMDLFLVSIDQLKAQLDFVPDFGDAEQATQAATTWPVTESGNTLTCEGNDATRG